MVYSSERMLVALLSQGLGRAIPRHSRFEWFEEDPPRDCGARGWAAGPGTHLDLDAIAKMVVKELEVEFVAGDDADDDDWLVFRVPIPRGAGQLPLD